MLRHANTDNSGSLRPRPLAQHCWLRLAPIGNKTGQIGADDDSVTIEISTLVHASPRREKLREIKPVDRAIGVGIDPPSA